MSDSHPSQIIEKADLLFCNLMEQRFGTFYDVADKARHLIEEHNRHRISDPEFETAMGDCEIAANTVFSYLNTDDISGEPAIIDLVTYQVNAVVECSWYDYISDSRHE